jgi:PAS domain S-box-containing protein
MRRSALVGLLYLENNLTTHAFTSERVTVLELLASQAAITLENARLYRDLAEREARIRRLVDANIVGILIFHLEGRILEANEAFLRIVGYDHEDLVSGRMHWKDLTPPEWLDRDNQRIAELKTTGTLQPFEKEYFRKDGSRASVLIGVAMFEGGESQGVGFVLDLTERKRAEAEAREGERRYREVQMELAHSNRAATMGQLTASIAHEIQQPIAAAAVDASAALRWLRTSRRHCRRDSQPDQESASTQGQDGHQRSGPRGNRTDEGRSVEERCFDADFSRGWFATRPGRSRTAATGDAQPDRQCRRSDGRNEHGPPRVADQHGRGFIEWRVYRRARLWPGATSGGDQARLRSVLHDEGEWPGHGPVDLPVNRRDARGTTLGKCKRAARRRLSARSSVRANRTCPAQ